MGRRRRKVALPIEPRREKPTYEIHHNTFDNKPKWDAVAAIARAVEVHAAALVELSRSINAPGEPMLHVGPMEPKV